MFGKQPLYPLAQLRVFLTSLSEERRPLASGLLQDKVEYGLVVHHGSPGHKGLYMNRRELDRKSTTGFRKQSSGRPPSASTNLGLKPDASIRPVSISRGWRNAEDLGRLFTGQSGKVPELDKLCLDGILGG